MATAHVRCGQPHDNPGHSLQQETRLTVRHHQTTCTDKNSWHHGHRAYRQAKTVK